jgi:hypothetical protein
MRRLDARRIAKDLRLDVEQVYQALSRVETDSSIRANSIQTSQIRTNQEASPTPGEDVPDQVATRRPEAAR